MIKKIIIPVILFFFSSMAFYSEGNEYLQDFESVCMDYNEDEGKFSEFVSRMMRKVERKDDERVFMLLYRFPDGARNFEKAEITLGVILDRFVKAAPPLYIRIFDGGNCIREDFDGDEGSFIEFYSLLLESLSKKDAALRGIPVIMFSAPEYIESGRFRAQIFIPVA